VASQDEVTDTQRGQSSEDLSKFVTAKVMSTDFGERFPVLDATLGKIEKMTDFQETRLALKFATDEELSDGTRRFFGEQMKPVIEAVDCELKQSLGDFWTILKSQSNLMVVTHTIIVLWRATLDPLFAKLSASDKNILKWACLLHDIAKRGAPNICGRDYTHAFRSAATSLEIFRQLGVLQEWNSGAL